MTWAWVTGASRGIGRAIAIELGRAGHEILVTYRTRRDDAEKVVTEISSNAVAVELDVSAGEETEKIITELIETHGCPDILVNNAGITHDTLFAVMGRDGWERVLATNLGSFYSVTRPIIRKMLRRKSGAIVNVASTAGQRGNAGQVNYSASKAGLIGATKALAIEVAPRNIRVNAVSPGFVETEMMAKVPVEKVLEHIPLGRTGTPEDVAHAVAFLCSERASYITGEILNVNGGLYT